MLVKPILASAGSEFFVALLGRTPNSYNWDDMNEQDSMTKMALGLYIKDKSLTQSNYNESSNPLWLSTNKQNSDDTANPDSPDDSQEPSSRTGTTEDTNANEVNVINQEFGSTTSSSPESAFLANDATLTFTGLVLLFFNFNTPDTKPLFSVVSS